MGRFIFMPLLGVLVAIVTTVFAAEESKLVSGQDSSTYKTFDCYFCSSSHGQDGVDGACANGFNPDNTEIYHYKNCAGSCTKTVIYDTETDEVVGVNRLCESECPGDQHCTQASHGRKTCSYCCTSHLCNSTTRNGIKSTTVAFLVLTALVMICTNLCRV
ncbi:uncharacterized protein [Ptychodera flava]|uniref:uncharacterized protein n=1 Tax=Ptychodera flava TaxID=63121 RepID=UPI00396A6065